MGGGLMQLVAYGAQDAFLTGNPEITFFKVVYRRHTNFAMESIRQNFNGSASWGSRATATISRNGDLISKCYLEAKLPYGSDVYIPGDVVVYNGVNVKLGYGAESGGAYPGALQAPALDAYPHNLIGTPREVEWCDSVGHKLIKEVELEIGGQLIDRHYAEWLEIWSELTLPSEKASGYADMVGKSDFRGKDTTPKSGDTVFVPLQFFFCRNPGLALPLIAMQYHEVKLNFTFESALNCVKQNHSIDGSTKPTAISPELWVDYVYLDTDERRRFAQVQHNMLVDQLQYNGGSSSDTIDLTFNHPCKELVWVRQGDGKGFDFDCETDNVQGGPIESAMLKLNGHDRFEKRNGAYFHLVQPYQHHTRCPRKYVYCYSFALSPEEHQPSGSCNFSRIDNARLILESNVSASVGTNKVFAVNYNVLRIQSGMAGLAFSN